MCFHVPKAKKSEGRWAEIITVRARFVQVPAVNAVKFLADFATR